MAYACSVAHFSAVLPKTFSIRCSGAEQADGPSRKVSFSQPSFMPRLASSSSDDASVTLAQVMNPALAHANIMYFKGTYNTQIFVGENESPESVVRRFRKATMDAGVVFECRRRRYHENPQDTVKRKQQDARRRKMK
eukprot:jgi/Mesen1/136/ME1128833C07565